MREWKIFSLNECPECSGAPEVLTASKVLNLFFDGEYARCSECKLTGCVSVGNSGQAGIKWSLDDYDESF